MGRSRKIVVKDKYEIPQFDPDMIHPTWKLRDDPDHGGQKIMVLGAPGTGKTNLMTDLAWWKQDIIPVAQAYCGTEDSNGWYKKKIPDVFTYNGLDLAAVEDGIKRQKVAKKHLRIPWCLTIFDDVTADKKIMKDILMQKIMKDGRHFKDLYLFGLQYGMDMEKSMRTCVDGAFLLAEPNMMTRETLYENFAGCIPTFDLFNEIMDAVTVNKQALYIHNRCESNNWEDRLFWWKANKVPDDWTFGCNEIWEFNDERRDPDYVDPL